MRHTGVTCSMSRPCQVAALLLLLSVCLLHTWLHPGLHHLHRHHLRRHAGLPHLLILTRHLTLHLTLHLTHLTLHLTRHLTLHLTHLTRHLTLHLTLHLTNLTLHLTHLTHLHGHHLNHALRRLNHLTHALHLTLHLTHLTLHLTLHAHHLRLLLSHYARTLTPALTLLVHVPLLRGLHSFQYQLNLRSSVHRVTQLNPECVLELLKLSSNVNEWKPLPLLLLHHALLFLVELLHVAGLLAAHAHVTHLHRGGVVALERPGHAVEHGLTLVPNSDQLEQFVWDRGCIKGVFRGCLGGVRVYQGVCRVTLCFRNGSI